MKGYIPAVRKYLHHLDKKRSPEKLFYLKQNKQMRIDLLKLDKLRLCSKCIISKQLQLF